jgi:NhaP-type Na+/H+ and K+/H+ antiporter
MLGVVGIIAFLTVLGLSLFITRLATIALTYTGLSWDAARFQARSAFTGTGFTTSEAERVVDHPVRRRIIMLLMIARSAGVVSIVMSLILSFGGSQSDISRLYRLLWVVGGVVVLLTAAKSRFIDNALSCLIKWALRKWTTLDVHDYTNLLKLSGEYMVTEIQVREGEWLVDKTLRECRLPEEGMMVLGIYRSGGSYVGIPRGETEIYADDTLVVYGRSKTLQELEQRRADRSGDQAHSNSVYEQKRYRAEQERSESVHKRKRERK